MLYNKKPPRDKFGKFIKGFHYSPKTEIKKGEHISKKTEISRGQHISKKTEFRKIFSEIELKNNRKRYSKRWRENNKKKIICHRLARKIKIPSDYLCQECNKKLARIKHHEDYNKPLKVKFLCYSCHNKKIENNRNFANRNYWKKYYQKRNKIKRIRGCKNDK